MSRFLTVKRISKRATKLTALLILLVLSYSQGLVQNSYGLVECTPDPADPLKCFCENIKNDLPEATDEQKSICDLNEADNDPNSTEGLLAENGIIKKVLNLLSWITGLLAGVYLIIGGAKLITSSGNSDAVTSGRKMIIYALVGIVVIISSNLIINFVIGLANNASK